MKYLLLSIIIAGTSLIGVPAIADAGVSVELETTIVGGGSSFGYPIDTGGVDISYPPAQVTIPSVNPVVSPVVIPEPEKQIEPKVEPKKETEEEPKKVNEVVNSTVDMSWVWFLIIPSIIVIIAFLLYRKYRRNRI